jgi:hypothetical protein
MTQQKLRTLVRLSAAVIFSTVAATSVGAQTLTGEQIAQSWAGKTLAVTGANGNKMTVQFRADGSTSVSGAASDTGRWNPIPNGYCTKWQRLNNREERCFTVTQTGPGKFEIKTPQCAVVSTAELQ